MVGGEVETELVLDRGDLGFGEAGRERESPGSGQQVRGGGHPATLAE